MAVKNLDPLGTIACGECSQQATVHQAQRGKGRYLYTRCPECKADQRTGKSFQTRLWHETNWYPGKKPEAPPANVSESDWSPDEDKPVKPTTAATVKTTEKAVAEPESKKGGKAAIVAGFAVVATVIGAVVVAARNNAQPQPKPMGGRYGY